MKLKSKNKLMEEEIKRLFEEELVRTVIEDFESGRMDENAFMKHMKSAGKGLFDYFKISFNNYAKMVDDMVNKQLVPMAAGQKIEDELEDIPDPQEFKNDDPGEQLDAVQRLQRLMQQTGQVVDDPKAQDKVEDMADAVAAVEDAVEDKVGGEEEAAAVSLKKLSKGQLNVALNQLRNKGLGADKVAAMFDKAADAISKGAGPQRSNFEKEDRPIIDAVKDQVVAILKGDLKSLKESVDKDKFQPGTIRFFASIGKSAEKNPKGKLINKKLRGK